MGSMVITNSGGEEDRLLSCTLKGVFAKAELHHAVMEGEDMRMIPVDSIEIGGGKTAVLRPNAYHVAFSDLPVELPQEVIMILKFEKTPPIEVVASVKQSKAAGTVDMRGVAPNLHHSRCHEK